MKCYQTGKRLLPKAKHVPGLNLLDSTDSTDSAARAHCIISIQVFAQPIFRLLPPKVFHLSDQKIIVNINKRPLHNKLLSIEFSPKKLRNWTELELQNYGNSRGHFLQIESDGCQRCQRVQHDLRRSLSLLNTALLQVTSPDVRLEFFLDDNL